MQSVDCHTVTTFQRPHVEAIRNLWKDVGIQECYNRRREYQLTDSIREYFLYSLNWIYLSYNLLNSYLEALDRISAPNYLPTQYDILLVRVRTTGIIEYTFDLQSVRFRYASVQKQAFKSIQSTNFIVALSINAFALMWFTEWWTLEDRGPSDGNGYIASQMWLPSFSSPL